jgi:ketosteroid isomerase-like protein
MTESERVRKVAAQIADAIARKDADAIGGYLAPGFLHRSPGGEAQDAEAFAQAIRGIPGEILFVRLEAVEIDVSEPGALVTGIQHAQVRIDGADVDDRRAFVDWFVKREGEWRLRVAVDLPSAEEPDAASRRG